MIVQTVPKITDKESLDNIIGMLLKSNIDGVRFNLSKYTLEEAIKLINNLTIYDDCKLNFFFDLPYPKSKARIRKIGVKNNLIQENKDYIITTDEKVYENNSNVILISNKDLNFTNKQIVYYADGQGAFRVRNIKDSKTIEATSINTFPIFKNKGVSGVIIENKKFIELAKNIDLNMSNATFLLSFTETEKDIEYLKKNMGFRSKIIAKIESQRAIDNIDRILRMSDGVLIARGDLVLNVPFEKLLEYTELIHEKAKLHGKSVIGATDILRNSDFRLIPQRAELVDVLNMFKLGTNSIILPSDYDLIEIDRVDVIKKINMKIEILEKCQSNYISGHLK